MGERVVKRREDELMNEHSLMESSVNDNIDSVSIIKVTLLSRQSFVDSLCSLHNFVVSACLNSSNPTNL